MRCDLNLDRALLCAELSAISYKEQVDVELFCKDRFKESFSQVLFFDHDASGTQGYGIQLENERYLVFRGTESNKELIDVVTDLLAFPKNKNHSKNYWVHWGFDNALAGVWDKIEPFLSQETHKKLFVMGHSLGGALALLCAIKLDEKALAFEAIYTYGQPRVLGKDYEKELSERLAQKYFRIQNQKDIVTQVPPYFFKYRHLGKSYYHLDEHQSVRKKNSANWVYSFQFFLIYLTPLFLKKDFWDFMKDKPSLMDESKKEKAHKLFMPLIEQIKKDMFGYHKIENYLTTLKKLASKSDCPKGTN